MAQHSASVTVNAPVDQVYTLFTHFNDYPKFMSYIKEVTYYDDQRSHWVADVVGHHEWDAVNENWIQNQQIGWRSTDGLANSGTVIFQPQGANNTVVSVTINYDPPAGFLGDIGESLGVGKKFETSLQHDLNNFATMVAQAPAGALDPMSSNYLFHADSAAAKGQTTMEQDRTMGEGQGVGYSPNSTSDTQAYGAGSNSTGSNTALGSGLGAGTDLDPETGTTGSIADQNANTDVFGARTGAAVSTDDMTVDSDTSRIR